MKGIVNRYKHACDNTLLTRGSEESKATIVGKEGMSCLLHLKTLQDNNKQRREQGMTTLKERYEEATRFNDMYEGLLAHVSKTMTDLEASEQEDTMVYDQSSRLFSYLNTDKGKSEYARMRWDDISSRCTEEEIDSVIEVEKVIHDNLELLEKAQLSAEGNNKIIGMLAEKAGME